MWFRVSICEQIRVCLGKKSRWEGHRATFLQLGDENIKAVDTENVHSEQKDRCPTQAAVNERNGLPEEQAWVKGMQAKDACSVQASDDGANN